MLTIQRTAKPSRLHRPQKEVDAILARLTAVSSEHINRVPEDVTWGDVGTLGCYLEGPRDIGDAACHDGEHAA